MDRFSSGFPNWTRIVRRETFPPKAVRDFRTGFDLLY